MLDFLRSNWTWIILGFLLVWWLSTQTFKSTQESLRNYPQYRPYPEQLGDPMFDGWEWFWYQKRKNEGVRLGGPNYLCPGCNPKLTSPKFNCWENIAKN